MSDYPKTTQFESATIILPVINETRSLIETVDAILATSESDLHEFLIVICEKTTPESIELVESLGQRLGALVVIHHQKLPFLGGAMQEAFDLSRGSHAIMMASDLETDPALVPQLIAEAQKHPDAVITASRWGEDGGFERYNALKLVANKLFQKFFAVLYSTSLSDLTYGYRIFPTRLIQAIAWEELRHPFLFETVLKPLRLGVHVYEIPAVWKARTEGTSQNTFARNFEYFKIGLKTRFYDPKLLLRPRINVNGSQGP